MSRSHALHGNAYGSLLSCISVFCQKRLEYAFPRATWEREQVKLVQKEKMQSLKALKASLLDRAFRGEL
ncbi:MAG: hypothetical protein COB07_08030 [Sulfurovum sp.]|nr:MAG: hypothetical protein COB07_08030 [Sulfurovum sp.]